MFFGPVLFMRIGFIVLCVKIIIVNILNTIINYSYLKCINHKPKNMNTISKGFKFRILSDCEFERMNNTIEIWYETKRQEGKYLVKYVRPFRVQKVLNNNLHLN